MFFLGYEVHGITRSSPSDTPERLAHLLGEGGVQLHHCDILDLQAMSGIVQDVSPTELYNMAAQSSVSTSFAQPIETMRVDGLGFISILELLRCLSPHTRIFQACSSEIFGRAKSSPQNERTPANPCSPYATAKLTAHVAGILYREAYEMYVCNGILYNHESSRRGGAFLTQKVVQAAVNISTGRQAQLSLGNLDAKRDWGHAEDFAECVWRMMQQEQADDFVVATGVGHTVREFVQRVFQAVGIDLRFEGKQLNEVGVNVQTGAIVVTVDAKYFRPNEPTEIIGNSQKAHDVLGWSPKHDLSSIIAEMVEAQKKRIICTVNQH